MIILKIAISCLCIIWGIISAFKIKKCDYLPYSKYFFCIFSFYAVGFYIGLPLGIILGIMFLVKGLILTIIKVFIPCLCIIWGIISFLKIGKCDYAPPCGVPYYEWGFYAVGFYVGLPLGIILGIIFLVKALICA